MQLIIVLEIAVLKEDMPMVQGCANLDAFNVFLFVLYLNKIPNYEETTFD